MTRDLKGPVEHFVASCSDQGIDGNIREWQVLDRQGMKMLCPMWHFSAVALFLAFAPLPAIAQSQAAASQSQLVATRTASHKEFEAALTSGASASDLKAVVDLAQTYTANLTTKLENSHLFSAAQIAGIAGSDGVAYVDNLIASSNPSQHPELLPIIDASFDEANAIIDLRESQANPNTVALERSRATLAARQQTWHTLFASNDPNGTQSASGQIDAPPEDHNSAPVPAPNAPPVPNMASIPQIDPATSAAPARPPSPVSAVAPVRHGTIPNNAPDPALQVNGPRHPAAPSLSTEDPAITVPDQPVASLPSAPNQSPHQPVPSVPSATGQSPSQSIEDAVNAPVHIPIAPVLVPPTIPPPGQGVPGNVVNPAAPPSDPIFMPNSNSNGDLGLPNGRTAAPDNGSSYQSNGAAAAGAGAAAANAAAAAAAEAGVHGGNGADAGSNSGGTPIVLPPSLSRPGRIGTSDQSGSGVAAIVNGVDGGSGPIQGGAGTGAQSSEPVSEATSGANGTSLAPIYGGYRVVPGQNGSSVIAVPSTAVQAPSSVLSAPSIQIQVPSGMIDMPSSQIQIPSAFLSVPTTQIPLPALCGR